jgi:hypothetical protein
MEKLIAGPTVPFAAVYKTGVGYQVPADFNISSYRGLALCHLSGDGANGQLVIYWNSESHFNMNRTRLEGDLHLTTALFTGALAELKVAKQKWWQRLSVKDWVLTAAAFLGALTVLWTKGAYLLEVPQVQMSFSDLTPVQVSGRDPVSASLDVQNDSMYTQANVSEIKGVATLENSDESVITRVSVDSNYVEHGFVRTPDGTITVFDVPGAGSVPGSYQGRYSASINDLGEAVGYYLDANYTAHGFLRAANGKITTFDDPAAGSGVYQGTWPNSINDFGVIVGATTYSDNSSQGLLRTKNGSYPDFQFPSPTDYNTAFINDRGVIAGSYAQAPFTDFVGYQRTADGRITVFEAPGSGTTTTYSYEGTWMNALNLQGTTTGYVQSADVESNSFIREANGKITVFELPGQAAVPGNYTGSGGFAINAAGVVTGKWYDTNLAIYGFLRLPN